MSSSSVEAFYDGNGIPVELTEVEQALDHLWGPAAEKAGGPELDSPAVTRVVLANVVLVNLGPNRPEMEKTIEAITTQYPSRLIILRPDPQAGRKLLAEVSAQCHLPAPGRPQVCSEQIILRTSVEGRDLLPGAVRSLVESDLHSVLWWCDDPREAPELFEQLAGEATRVILDLPDPEADPGSFAAALKADEGQKARDLAWFGLTTWRSLIADQFDAPVAGNLGRIVSIRVRSNVKDTDRPSRAAAWLVGWLAGQLGWKPEGSPQILGDGRCEASLRGREGLIKVVLESVMSEMGALAQIEEVEITLRPDTHPATTLTIQCGGEGTCEICVTDGQGSGCAFPRLVKVPRDETAHRVSAALLTDRSDPPYHRAFPITLWLLGG
ncbi:glucose-6-phosphate dehydrogenase assembly protein OpcA [Tautonia rosea]|uniref:glucose-6-phosphate dehydrogenase assembly protein OpcA n=1 Tax=Tautonia rosea TaxID=2728037 RepID=UPI0014761845|nr:glucose-6-phosphate dehydrogenase assembly protein OpcA [Tautonia rosea]